MELKELTKFNPWWTTGKVREEWLVSFKRVLFYDILEYLNERQILLIMGLRRTGKTTIMFQLIEELLKKMDRKKILYFSFDEKIGDLKDVIENYQNEVLGESFENSDRIYLFLDEIQKCENWEEKLKIYYDLYPNLKFIISGSASINLDKRSKESLAGRIYDFTLDPLSFSEFIELKRGLKLKGKKTNELKLYERELLPEFFDYMKKGGFPEIVHEKEDKKIKNYIKNSVIERIIYRDIPSEFGLRDIKLLRSLSELIANNPGMIVNYNKISRNLGKDRRVISNYFSYLEHVMILRFSYNFRNNFIASTRKLKKVYLSSTGTIFALNEDYERILPKVFENLIVSSLKAKFFWRERRKEVDVILKWKGNPIPIEIKYGKSKLGNIPKFMERFKADYGFIVTKKTSSDKMSIIHIPAWMLLIKGIENFL